MCLRRVTKEITRTLESVTDFFRREFCEEFGDRKFEVR